MAFKFAAATGNWNTGATWDDGTVPANGDIVFPNGFTVTVDTNISPDTLSAAIPTISVVGISTPAMTSNSSPSGTASASSNSSNAYLAFNQQGFTGFWQSGVVNTGTLQYQFPTGKIIKRYVLKGNPAGSLANPRNWTFDGSNDGSSWTTLETVTAYSMAAGGLYTSSVLANSTSYTYYRISITAVQTAGNAPYVSEFEMTESTSANTGVNSGGNFLVSSGSITINATTLTQSVTTPLITVSHGSGTVTLTSTNDVTGTSASSTLFLLNHTSSGRLDISAPNLRSQGLVISHTSSGPLNITANLITVSNNINVITSTGSGTVTIVGNTTGTATGANGINKNAGDLNITGNSTGAGANGITFGSSGTCTFVGNLNGGTSGAGISCTAGTTNITGAVTAAGTAGLLMSNAAAVSLTGGVTASSSAAGVSGTGTGVFTLIGNAVNNGALMAIYNTRVNISAAATTTWAFFTSTPSARTLYSDDSFPNSPATGDVRLSTTYGPGLSLTGTLIVPTPSNVLAGVGTDNTVGTYSTSTTPAAIATEIFTKLLSSSDFNTSGSFGKLIKDNLDDTISSRAPSSTALSTAQWTNTRAGLIDNLDATVSSRLASASYTAPDNTSITAIKAKTDNLPSDPASDTTVNTRASQSSVNAIPTNPLLTSDTRLNNLDATISSRLASAGYTAPDNSSITAIKAKTDNLPSDPASDTTVNTRASQTTADSIKSNTDLIPATV